MKGLFGIVKDATVSTVKVELHTQPKTINIDRAKVAIVGDGAPSASNQMNGMFGRTPNPNDARGRTPMYGAGAQTPMYGGMGSQTPMHDYGSRTPHYGAMTPAYDGAGGRTPSHSSSWDPAVANTPAYSSGGNDNDDDDFGNDGFGNSGFGSESKTNTSFGASSSFDNDSFGNDGFENSGFGNSSFGTEKSDKNNKSGNDKFEDDGFANDGFANSGFGNSGFGSSTPGSNRNSHSRGNPSHNSSTSKMYSDYSAQSPYPRSNYNSATASPYPQQVNTIAEHVLKSGNWINVNSYVTVRRTYPDEESHGIEGVVKSITNDGKCQVYYEDLDGDRKIGFEYLLPVKPRQGDKARVVYGQYTGKQGVVISVDGAEGVLKTTNGEMHAVPMALLCKTV